MSGLNSLSRVALLDYKRAGLTDAGIATLCDSTAESVATRRHQLGVPALACDVSLSAPASKVRSSPAGRERSTKERPVGTGTSTRGIVWDDEPMRTSDEAEAHFRDFFGRHPNFSHDNVRVRPMRRLTLSAATLTGTGASALYDA